MSLQSLVITQAALVLAKTARITHSSEPGKHNNMNKSTEQESSKNGKHWHGQGNNGQGQ
jgi:hypothetical protein